MPVPEVCVTLSGHTVEEMLQDAALATAAAADLVEVRFDHLWVDRVEIEPEDPEGEEERERRPQVPEYTYELRPLESIDANSAIETLKAGIRLPVVFACRSESEGGHYPGDEEERLAILRTAIESGVSWIDLEISIEEVARQGLRDLCGERTRIVASTHLPDTPEMSSIVELVESSSDAGDLTKVCVTCSSHHDGLRIFEAAWSIRDSDQPRAMMGVGLGGDWPRIHAPILGQNIVYSTMEQGWHLAKEGRMNLEDLRLAWDLLEYDS